MPDKRHKKKQRERRKTPQRSMSHYHRRLTGHHFHRLSHPRSSAQGIGKANGHAFFRQLADQIVSRFARFSRLDVLTVPLDLMSDDCKPLPPAHPKCINFAETSYCQDSWQLHCRQLRRHPRTHWHKCDYGRLCAIVPLVFRKQCLILFKLACDNSVSETEFRRDVELLDMIVANTGYAEAVSLTGFFADKQAAADTCTGPGRRRQVTVRPSSHPKVLKAIEHIEHALSDHDLSVSLVARSVGLHADYLAHLFAGQVGQRMSRYIACRRVERAKNLLAGTTLSVEQVADRSGFANPKWFYHVFQAHTGQTPAGYRQQQAAGGRRRV